MNTPNRIKVAPRTPLVVICSPKNIEEAIIVTTMLSDVMDVIIPTLFDVPMRYMNEMEHAVFMRTAVDASPMPVGDQSSSPLARHSARAIRPVTT